MSKYTTEVRYICENECGADSSNGSSNVDYIINNSWAKIFTTNIEFFDEEYRKVLCCKILKHYYLREIGCETVGLWKLWINTKLEEIMPYYNQLYKSALIEFNPMHDTELKREHGREFTGDVNTKENNNINSDSTNWQLYSETPQGSISDLDSNSYLTNATKDTSKNKTDTTNNGNTKTTTTENYIEKISGKNNGNSFSKMLKEFRDTFLNIDMMVVKEFEDLFFMLW